MRVESILTSVFIGITLIHISIPVTIVWLVPSLIAVLVLLHVLREASAGQRYLHLLTICIPCIIAAFCDPIVALWLRIGGVVSSIILSIILYNIIDSDCTLEFKNECFRGVLADISQLNIIIASLDLYFNWWAIASSVSLVITAVYGIWLLYEPLEPNPSIQNLTDNSEQQALFGINDDNI